MPARASGVISIAVAFAVAAGCGAARSVGGAPDTPAVGMGPARVRSNILRGDYAGSARCAGCHADVVAAWTGSPMHLMTRDPATARIQAPFDGTTFHFKDDAARLTEKDGQRFVELTSPAGGDHLYRVTRVIGGRYREDFAGIEVDPAAGAPIHAGDRELILPISYVFETRSFRLKGYSVLVTERPGLRAGGVWNQTCVFCHNTVPYFDDTWGALYDQMGTPGGFPIPPAEAPLGEAELRQRAHGAPGYQGEVVDTLLPAARRFRFQVAGGGEPALTAAVAAEVVAVGGTPFGGGGQAALAHGIHELRGRFAARHFVELGIGCEACHGGSREHADDPRVLPDFAPHSPFLASVPEAGGEVTRAERINRACARCHQVLFSRYPFTWEGGHRRGDDPGGSSITSGEGRDFLMGGCARQMSCVTCHDPHAEDRRADLDRLATPAGNGICVRCHTPYAAPAALAAHAHHDPSGAGASCVGCHMPRKNMGLGYALTRYHRIGLPDDPVRVERDRPIECALCHVDKSVGDLAATMERWWGRKYDRAALETLYGSLEARPLEATLTRGKAHEQAVALATLGAAHVPGAAPAVARQLVNPFPLVRYYARRALGMLPGGAGCAVDLDRPTAEIVAAVRACLPAAFPDGAPVASPPATGHDVVDED
ncbi:MAG TPA: cytochrome c3 family protein [Polyangia bacterium]|nr:cytochrome c3 family protein [Polyangia bacterium]